MSQQFVKGRTNNHLTWVMVDATDFATPESAASAATTIKIYGKNRGGTTTALVSSGTGSLTNDIQHVGASALGIYTIALVKADLSDASAAWYDHYVIALSCTGCARQTLVVDGGIDASALSSYQSRLSDLASYLVAMSGMLSDAHSAAILAASTASEAQSNILLVQSRLSDFQSVYTSDMSDLVSFLSNFQSDLHSFVSTTGVQLNASSLSDIRSAIAAGPAATVTASDISDIASAVRAILVSDLSDIYSAANQTNSRVILVQSRLSDYNSAYASDFSDIRSQLTVIQSIASDAHSAATQANSRALVIQSIASDTYSLASNINSATLAAPDTSDFASAVWSEKYTTWATASTFGSALLLNMSRISDIQSYLVVMSGVLSDTYSAALVNTSAVSDMMSFLSDFRSDLHSFVSTTGVQLNASTLSDIRSAIAAGPAATVTASDISDIASAVRAIIVSDLSDIYSAANQANSRVILIQSRLSDFNSVYTSDISDIKSFLSDFKSTVDVTGVQLNASTMSDIRSAITAGTAATITTSDISDIASAVRALMVSDLSDIYSAAAQTNSRVILVQSRLSDYNSAYASDFSDIRSQLNVIQSIASDAHSAATASPAAASALSDIYSLLSDLHSDVTIMSGVVSDVYSNLAAGVTVGASSMSDISSRVWATQGTDPGTVPATTATLGAKLDWLTALSRNKITQTSTVQSLRNDADAADIASAAVSDDGTTFTRGKFA